MRLWDAGVLPSFESAPRRKKSQSERAATAATMPAARSLDVRLAIKKFFNCSKTVYWMIGFITRINAGPIPRQKALDARYQLSFRGL